MTKSNAAQYIPLVKALAEGKTIQFFSGPKSEWEDVSDVAFSFTPEKYRIKPKKELITDFDLGDVFYSQKDSCRVLIVQAYLGNYYLAGFGGLEMFNDTGKKGFSTGKMLDFLNKNGYSFVRNINAEIAGLISN